jgi:hypothetical protein
MNSIKNSTLTYQPNNLTCLTWSGSVNDKPFVIGTFTDKDVTDQRIASIQANTADALEKMEGIITQSTSRIIGGLKTLTDEQKSSWSQTKMIPDEVRAQFSEMISLIVESDTVVGLIIDTLNKSHFEITDSTSFIIAMHIRSVLMKEVFAFQHVGCFTAYPTDTDSGVWSCKNDYDTDYDSCAELVRNNRPTLKPMIGMLYASCLDG